MNTCIQNESPDQVPQLISYLTLRKLIGILGLTFPFILLAGTMIFGHCKEIQNSISHYYYTNMRNIFEGIIFAVALFLFTYKGYDKRDHMAASLAGAFALGLALFPTSVDLDELSSCIITVEDQGIINTLHFICAAGFFLTLSWFSLCLFRIKAEPVTPRKLIRNKIYTACGIVMLACVLIIAIYLAFLKNRFPALQALKPVFLFETIALVAFGISWLTKGKAIMDDIKPVITNPYSG